MSAWEEFKIKDVVLGLYDGPHATPPPSDAGPVFLGIQNIKERGGLDLSQVRHINEAEWARWTKRITPQRNDIVFTYEATLNLYAVIPEGFRGCLGRRMALLRANDKKINFRYLYYYFFSPQWRQVISENLLSGATVDRIPLTRFPDFKIIVPDRSTQDAIVSYLSAIDELIELNEARIRILGELPLHMYREWFVNFKFPGHEKVKLVDSGHSDFGMIPNEWVLTELSKIAFFNYGKALRAEDRTQGQFPVYGSSGAVGTHDVFLVEGPGIIVGRKGNVGSVFYCPKNFFPIDTVYYINRAQATPFVLQTLKSIKFLSGDAAVPGLNREYAHSRPVLFPTADILNQFDSFALATQLHLENIKLQNESLARMRDLLLPKLLSGEVDVSDLKHGHIDQVGDDSPDIGKEDFERIRS